MIIESFDLIIWIPPRMLHNAKKSLLLTIFIDLILLLKLVHCSIKVFESFYHFICQYLIEHEIPVSIRPELVLNIVWILILQNLKNLKLFTSKSEFFIFQIMLIYTSKFRIYNSIFFYTSIHDTNYYSTI